MKALPTSEPGGGGRSHWEKLMKYRKRKTAEYFQGKYALDPKIFDEICQEDVDWLKDCLEYLEWFTVGHVYKDNTLQCRGCELKGGLREYLSGR